MKTYITNKVLFCLGAICACLAAADFFRESHSPFAVEHAPLFFAAFGFFVYVLLIFLSKGLRRLILRPEDYYGSHATDQEDERLAGAESQADEASHA